MMNKKEPEGQVHTCTIEIIINPKIEEIRELLITSSQRMGRWDISSLEERLHSCFCASFHTEVTEDGTLLVCTPEENLETESAWESIYFLKTVQDAIKDIMPSMNIEVCMTFIHATPKELVHYKVENLLQQYAHQIHMAEVESQRMLKNTITPLDEVYFAELRNDLVLLKSKASEASILLAAL